jgi:hypothetical protein
VTDESVSAMEITHAARDASISSKHGSISTVVTRVNDLSSSSEGVLWTSVFHSETSEETCAGEYTRTEIFIPPFIKTSSPSQQGSDDPAGDQQGARNKLTKPPSSGPNPGTNSTTTDIFNPENKLTTPPSSGVPNPGKNSTTTDIFNPQKVLQQFTTSSPSQQGSDDPAGDQQGTHEVDTPHRPVEFNKLTKPPSSGVPNPGTNSTTTDIFNPEKVLQQFTTSSPSQQGSDDPAGGQQGTYEVDTPHTPRAAVDAEIALEGRVKGLEFNKQTKTPGGGPNPGGNSTKT